MKIGFIKNEVEKRLMHWSSETEKLIKKEKEVYIYGAGNWGSIVVKYCIFNEINVRGIITTSLDNNIDEIYGIRVQTVSDELDRNVLVVIAINGRTKKEIVDRIKEYGFSKWLEIDSVPRGYTGYEYNKRLDSSMYMNELKIKYWMIHKEILNLDNPQTFTEKIQWIKLYGDLDRMAELADKLRVRNWIKTKVGDNHLIPLLGYWDNFDDINFDMLPDRFVLKCNHGCGYNLIVKDKREFNVKQARNKIQEWLHEDYGMISLEPHYSRIDRKIIAEEYIEQINGDLYDYKIHCFGGEPKVIQLIGERNLELHLGKQAVYDTNWNTMEWSFGDYPRFENKINKPERLQELLDIARKLSEGINYVRVDLYLLNEIKVGELTFTPGSGSYIYNDDWTPEANKFLGRLIELP